MILIVAGNHIQAGRYAQRIGIETDQWAYVFGPHSLSIKKDIKDIHFTGTWEFRKDLPYIKLQVKKYGMREVIDNDSEV